MADSKGTGTATEDFRAEAMVGGYHRTGDIGSRDADGYITCIARAAERLRSVNIRGLFFSIVVGRLSDGGRWYSFVVVPGRCG
ncbi:hypothetical protein NGB36_21620 [Streptomyces sp. RB6PN25]|uniref:Uncharacterized protein n=1 Tax=Streptomyces humicola TaxID=2953240 RepID=A0ABT1PZP6_9ACTN|nr:hypothetical protein [Streptomyces humicola]MCQ4083134.1 hypothetical protein [Streptomyces humicola]